MDYDFKSLESKWQKKWEKGKVFEIKKSHRFPRDDLPKRKASVYPQARNSGAKKKFYCLEMFPYPSASGLHMGHAFNYTIGDIYSRFKRMQGFNVLYPMGFDAFGLPAENAAIKAHQHPKKYTENAITNYIRQMKKLGLSYDWSKTVRTCDKEYYKWNQFFFLKFLKKGLVYKKKALVNWCPKCKTVLANEQVHNGKCWRHEDTNVDAKQLEQWFIKTTFYADELLNCIDDLKWPDRIKTMQKNWIGKSHGTEINFKIIPQGMTFKEASGEVWPIFTTRPDTIYGVTFMVISAQHLRLMELVTKEQKKEVDKFLKKLKSVSEKDKVDLDKLGVFTGSYAINPLTNEKVPVWVGNFVVADYGSGMVMGVPAHDQRDFEFAKKYGIGIEVVIVKKGSKEIIITKTRTGNISAGETLDKAYTDEGILCASEEFNGLENKKAVGEITKYLSKKKLGKKDIQYKLKDWLVSRQRYWGTPIPVVYCDKCGIVPVNEKDLPVVLPEKVRFGKGNPLESAKNWINTTCPKCKGKARRETDTMDTFFDSSWYFLRYCDNKNSKIPFDKKKIDYWMPVDQYIGGAEHACMHLVYARFFIKALRDLGFLKFDEPFTKLFNQGMLHGSDGNKMSKSLGNVVLPEEVSEKYGIDTARLFLVSIASPDSDIYWSEKGIKGSLKFIKKLMNYFKKVKIVTPRRGTPKRGKTDAKIESKLNKVIRETTKHIKDFKYNLAIIQIRNLFNSLPDETSKEVLEKFLKLLHPFCPHITEELWNKLGNKSFISLEKWPVIDEKKIDKNLEKQEKAIEQLIEDVNHIKGLIKKKVSKGFIYVLPNEKDIYFEDVDLIHKKTNLDIEIFSVNDKQKYDPENKSKKVKPGRPGIYLE